MQGLLHTELYVEALTVFVKAFDVSAFCLESLEEVTEKLMYALDLVLHNHMRKYGHQPMPDVWCEATNRYCYALHTKFHVILLQLDPACFHLLQLPLMSAVDLDNSAAHTILLFCPEP